MICYNGEKWFMIFFVVSMKLQETRIGAYLSIVELVTGFNKKVLQSTLKVQSSNKSKLHLGILRWIKTQLKYMCCLSNLDDIWFWHIIAGISLPEYPFDKPYNLLYPWPLGFFFLITVDTANWCAVSDTFYSLRLWYILIRCCEYMMQTVAQGSWVSSRSNNSYNRATSHCPCHPWSSNFDWEDHLLNILSEERSPFGLSSKKKERKAFNIYDSDKDFKDWHGWSRTVTRKDFHELKGSNFGLFLVYLAPVSAMELENLSWAINLGQPSWSWVHCLSLLCLNWKTLQLSPCVFLSRMLWWRHTGIQKLWR